MSDKERADRATELLHELYEWQQSPMPVPVEVMQKIDDFLNPVPNFGEPWWEHGERIRNTEGDVTHRTEGKVVVMSCFSEEIQARIIACVNACKGMRDPSAEIAALRAAANKTTTGPT